MKEEKSFQQNGYTFTVYDTGTVNAKGVVQDQKAERSNYLQRTAGGELRQSNHQGGHLIGAQMNGPAIKENLSAQDKDLNMGAYKTIENCEMDLTRQGYTVETDKTAYVSSQKTDKGMVPDAYMTNDTITSPDGSKTVTVNISQQNLSPEEQEEMNNVLSESNFSLGDDFPNPDPARESMSTEEYNSIMEEADAYVNSMSIKDEYDVENMTEVHFDNYDNVDISPAEDVSSAESVDGGIDGGDGGIDGGDDGGIE